LIITGAGYSYFFSSMSNSLYLLITSYASICIFSSYNIDGFSTGGGNRSLVITGIVPIAYNETFSPMKIS
jgi:hypothetical protein